MIITNFADCLRHISPALWRRNHPGRTRGGFALLELGFFAPNLSKLGEGGWFPLTLGAGIFLMLTTWKRRQPGRVTNASDRHSHERLHSPARMYRMWRAQRSI